MRPICNPDFYVTNNYMAPALSPDVYVTRPYAPVADRLRAYVVWAKAVPGAVALIQANLHPPLSRPSIDVGRLRFGGLASYLTNDIPAAFAGAKDAALEAEFKRANAAAVKAFLGLDAWLESQRKTQTETFALGAARFSEMLRATERVDVPLDRPGDQLGRDDLARNLSALRDACGDFAPGVTVTECIARQSAHKPAGGIVAGGTRQLQTLESFVRAHDLVTIPGTERALVHESPPYQRGNLAYIDTSGPLEQNLPAIYYISPPDPKWTKAEQEAYLPSVANLLFTSVHEVWPGHFLQFQHSNRAPSIIGRVFVSYAFAEGWAHYCEEMMWEAGLGDGDPETHIGQLLNALLRDALPLSDRHAYRQDDRGTERDDVPGGGVPGCWDSAATGRAGHLRSRVSQLHARQADAPKAACRLGRHARGTIRMESVPRRSSQLWRTAHSWARAEGDGR